MTSWSHNDELFFKELREGHAWQSLPATFFRLHGLDVKLPDLQVRESIAEAAQWQDSVDLFVEGFAIEIKSRNESFYSPESFPYSTVLVDTVSGYDNKLAKPLAYCMISRPTGCMLTLRGTSSKGWSIESKFDRIRKIQDDFYVADRKRLQTLDCLIKYLKQCKNLNC